MSRNYNTYISSSPRPRSISSSFQDLLRFVTQTSDLELQVLIMKNFYMTIYVTIALQCIVPEGLGRG